MFPDRPESPDAMAGAVTPGRLVNGKGVSTLISTGRSNIDLVRSSRMASDTSLATKSLVSLETSKDISPSAGPKLPDKLIPLAI